MFCDLLYYKMDGITIDNLITLAVLLSQTVSLFSLLWKKSTVSLRKFKQIF